MEIVFRLEAGHELGNALREGDGALRDAVAAQAVGDLELELARMTPAPGPPGPALQPKTRIMVSSSQTKDARVSLDGDVKTSFSVDEAG